MEFYKHALLFLFLPFLQYFHLSEAGGFKSDCPQDDSKADNTVLKLAFVLDQTYSFSPVWKKIDATWPMLITEVSNLYQDSDWAFTTFADYQKDAKPEMGDDEINPHNLKEGCYGRRQTFTKNSRPVGRIIGDIKSIRNGGKENSLQALAHTVKDKYLLWDNATEGKTVKRVAILMTERGYSNILANPEDRREFVGDGSDLCAISKPPTIQQVGEILKTGDVAVIGVLPFGTFEPDVLQTYEQYFQQMEGVPFCGKTFDMATELNPEIIASSIISCLKQLC